MEALKVRPLRDRVIVRPDEVTEYKSKGGIIIPKSAQEKPFRGTVVAAGRGTPDEPMEVKVGDEILHGKYSGTEIEYDGQKYLIMREADILCIL